MLSQTVEYALRAVTCLAHHAPAPQTSEQLAELAKVPQAYLPKVMLNLNRSGIVRSQRGPHGGFSLAKSPSELNLLEVVNAVDPLERIHECPLGLKSHGSQLCPLHRKLDDTIAATREAFESTTLASLLQESNGSIPLCEKPIESGFVKLD